MLVRVGDDETGAALLLRDLLGARDCGAAIGAGAALSAAFADLGLPIGASG